MARKNPLEEVKKRYFRNLKIRKIYPLLLYYGCVKCGYEFCREQMYECKERDVIYNWSSYYNGCSHCFKNKDEFRKYLEDKGFIYAESDFVEKNKKLIL